MDRYCYKNKYRGNFISLENFFFALVICQPWETGIAWPGEEKYTGCDSRKSPILAVFKAEQDDSVLFAVNKQSYAGWCRPGNNGNDYDGYVSPILYIKWPFRL